MRILTLLNIYCLDDSTKKYDNKYYDASVGDGVTSNKVLFY